MVYGDFSQQLMSACTMALIQLRSWDGESMNYSSATNQKCDDLVLSLRLMIHAQHHHLSWSAVAHLRDKPVFSSFQKPINSTYQTFPLQNIFIFSLCSIPCEREIQSINQPCTTLYWESSTVSGHTLIPLTHLQGLFVFFCLNHGSCEGSV